MESQKIRGGDKLNTKINAFIKQDNLFNLNSKAETIEKNKGFELTLKKHNENQDKVESNNKNQKISKNNENRDKEDEIKSNKRPNEDRIENNEQVDSKDASEKENILYLNVFQSFTSGQKIQEVFKNTDLDIINQVDGIEVLETLLEIDTKGVDDLQFVDKDIVTNLLNNELVEDKLNEIKRDESTILENNVDIKEEMDTKMNIDSSRNEETQSLEKINDQNIFEIKQNTLKQNNDENKDFINNEKNSIIETKDLSESVSKEDTKNSNETSKFNDIDLEDSSINKTSDELTDNNKVDFSIKSHLNEIVGTNDINAIEEEVIDRKEFIQHIIEEVKFDLGNNKNQIKVSLKPETLGQMIMELEVIKNGFIAKITVDNQRAKELIEHNLYQLKEGIKDSGLEIKTFEVFVGNNSDFDKHNSNGFNFNRNNKKAKLNNKNKDKDKQLKVYEENTPIENNSYLNLKLESSLNLFA